MSLSEQTRKRIENQAAILHCLREHGAMSRSRISERCEIRKASVTHICRDLVERGVVDELQPGVYRSAVQLSSRYWRALSIHISPREITAASVRHDGIVEQRWKIKTGRRSRPDAILPLVSDLIAEAQKSSSEFAGIGISIPGIVDVARGVCLSAVNLGAWAEVPVVEALASETNGPGILVENDAAAGLMGNLWFQKADSGPDEVIYLALGEGVGCAQMSGGRLVRGQHFAAGEIGCLPSGSEGRECSCGKVDCLQTYCGAKGLRRSLVEIGFDLDAMTLAEIGKLAGTDERLRFAFREALRPLVEKVATIVALSDPTSLVIATQEPALAEIVPAVVSAGLQEMLGGSAANAIPVRQGLDPVEACLLGSAATVFGVAFASETLRVERREPSQVL